MSAGLIALIISGAIIFAISIYLTTVFSLWLQALTCGARIPFFKIISFQFKRIPPRLIVGANIKLAKAGLNSSLYILSSKKNLSDSFGYPSITDLETHHLAGGNVERVVDALIAADKGCIPLKFKHAAAIDLAGRNVLEDIKGCVCPKVMETPRIITKTKDGSELALIAKVTLRNNLNRLVGGAAEETVIARIVEALITSIPLFTNCKEVIEKHTTVTQNILKMKLDSGTLFDILDISIVNTTTGNDLSSHAVLKDVK